MADPEKMLELRFPIAGTNLSTAFDQQPPLTTILGLNVRGNEPVQLRLRGGSRPGLSKYLPQLPSGSTAFQSLGIVAWTDPNALYLPAVDSTGIIDPSDGGRGGELVRQGGSAAMSGAGGATKKAYKVVLVASSGSAPNDGTPVTLTATVTKGGVTQGSIDVRLVTTPSGKVGDQTIVTTDFLTGQAVFTVSDTFNETVSYEADSLGSAILTVRPITGRSNVVPVSYTGSLTYTYTGVIQSFDSGTVCVVIPSYHGSDGSSGFTNSSPPHTVLLDANPPYSTPPPPPIIGNTYQLYDNRAVPDPKTITSNLRFAP